jgi:hypothetical protein
MSSLARTPGPCVRIALEARMLSVCVVCAFFCVPIQVSWRRPKGKEGSLMVSSCEHDDKSLDPTRREFIDH